MSLTVLLGQLSGSHRADSGFDVRFHCLPAEELLDFCGSEDFISRFMQQHSSHSREAIFGLESHVAAVVLDLFSTTFLDVTCNLDLPGYVYFTSTASLLSLVLRLLVLDQEMLVDFEEMEDVVDLLGLLSVPATLLPTPVIKKDCVEIMGKDDFVFLPGQASHFGNLNFITDDFSKISLLDSDSQI
ncbi:UDP-glycosyltransferase 71A16 [Oryza sativa Japonica Group]|uniref:UDP-glycosyltransferase 71A16 n=1 Tax=Oryza sativa subsp. japonica TaxID=39947 RepID=UPI0007755DE9|nr:UDP-glycosyltransferase 71A16 [Oryza sativa Japonica Group]